MVWKYTRELDSEVKKNVRELNSNTFKSIDESWIAKSLKENSAVWCSWKRVRETVFCNNKVCLHATEFPALLCLRSPRTVTVLPRGPFLEARQWTRQVRRRSLYGYFTTHEVLKDGPRKIQRLDLFVCSLFVCFIVYRERF